MLTVAVRNVCLKLFCFVWLMLNEYVKMQHMTPKLPEVHCMFLPPQKLRAYGGMEMCILLLLLIYIFIRNECRNIDSK